jgi:hypothetical protein
MRRWATRSIIHCCGSRGSGEPYQDVIREEWGIEPPRLYAMGFPHNNCGGRCIKQGVKEWLRLRYHFPERFEVMKQWELAQRAKGGARATHAICSEERNKVRYPLTLEEIERRRPRGALRAANAGNYQWQRIQGRSRAVLLRLCMSCVFGACNECVNSSGDVPKAEREAAWFPLPGAALGFRHAPFLGLGTFLRASGGSAAWCSGAVACRESVRESVVDNRHRVFSRCADEAKSRPSCLP